MMNIKGLFLSAAIAAAVTAAHASELTYEPVNPSFGGSPLNGSWMLAQAQIQDPHGYLKDPTRPAAAPGRDLMANFKNSLASQILSKLASSIVASAFGEGELKDGQYQVGDYLINVTSDVSGITVDLTDVTNGNSTIVEIPYY